jgi:hypothetical protein
MGNRRRLILINLLFASEVAVACDLSIFPRRIHESTQYTIVYQW